MFLQFIHHIGCQYCRCHIIIPLSSLNILKIYKFSCYFTLVLKTAPSARFTSLNNPDSSTETTLEEYLMVPLGSSLSSASINKLLLTDRTSWPPLSISYYIINTHSHTKKVIEKNGNVGDEMMRHYNIMR